MRGTPRLLASTVLSPLAFLALLAAGTLGGGGCSSGGSYHYFGDLASGTGLDGGSGPEKILGGTPDLAVSASCSNNKLDGQETDIDCGGGTCPKCAGGRMCLRPSDCQTAICLNNVCAQPSCSDSIKDQDETDIDCGGAVCNPCVDGRACLQNRDCQSANCVAGKCAAAPNCFDGQKNGSETAVDCGGPDCAGCGNGLGCLINGDCNSNNCVNRICVAAPSCNDLLKNQDETDVDCGGLTCPGCAVGKVCKVNGDCQSGLCTNGLCKAQAGCLNGGKTPPAGCVNGTDPETGASYVVCWANCTTAYITGINGMYHALQICNNFGYSKVGSYGGTCGVTCGNCNQATSCQAPNLNPTFDGAGGNACPADQFGIVLCTTVHWECSK